MSSLQHKIDFAVILTVDRANPNGDPLNGNRPRIDYDGFGEISDVCIKRKIRDRLLENGNAIFVQSDGHPLSDDYGSLKARALGELGKNMFELTVKKRGGKKKGKEEEKEAPSDTDTGSVFKAKRDTVNAACKKWFDVRAFGQLFAFKIKDSKSKKGKEEDLTSQEQSKDTDGVSIPIRGPVSIQHAYSIEPVSVSSFQIVKSTDNEPEEGKNARMGMKHRVDKGIYVFYGSINPQLAERTGFSDADAEVIKGILPRLFENDASSARPEGTMEVKEVIWWKHNSKSGQYSSAKVHRSLKITPEGMAEPVEGATPGLIAERIPGF